jgi:hypothetical protein
MASLLCDLTSVYLSAYHMRLKNLKETTDVYENRYEYLISNDTLQLLFMSVTPQGNRTDI